MKINRILITLSAMIWFVITVAQPRTHFIQADHPAFSYFGRTDRTQPAPVRFDWPGVYLRCAFTGNTLWLHLKGGMRDYFNVFVDNQPVRVIHSTSDSLFIIEGITGNNNHELMITKRTEADMGVARFYGISLLPDEKILPSSVKKLRKIEFIGNSITCGYGAEGLSGSERFKPETENSYLSYAAITARAFDADYALVAHSGLGIVRNYNDKSKISTKLAPMPPRFGRVLDTDSIKKWDFSLWVPDAVVINLGTNDYSTLPHPDKAVFKRRYEELITKISQVYGAVPVFCVAGPMTNEPCYSIVKEVVEDFNLIHKVPKIYFAGIPSGLLNNTTDLGSDGHPSYRGQRKTALILVPLLANVMKWNYNDNEIRFPEEF